MRLRWLPWSKPPDNGRDAVIAKNEASRKLDETLSQSAKVDDLANRLHEQLHRRNQLGKLFDEAFRGTK